MYILDEHIQNLEYKFLWKSKRIHQTLKNIEKLQQS